MGLKSFFSSKFCCATLAFVGCITPVRGWTEGVGISGLSFPVDEIAPVDAKNVRVSLFGTAEIVSRDKIESYVIQKYFSSPEHVSNFSFETLREFIKTSVKDDRFDQAVAAFEALCVRDGVSRSKEILDLLRALEASFSNLEFFKRLFPGTQESHCPDEIVAEALFQAGFTDREWLRAKGLREVYVHDASLRAVTEQKAYQAGLAHNFDEMARVVDFYGIAFGAEDSRALELKAIVSKIQLAVEEMKRGELDALYPIIDLSRSGNWLSEMLFPLLIEKMHEGASEAIERHDEERALTVLSHIDIKKRTPTTHDLILKAVRALVPNERPVILDSAVALMLRTVSIGDARVRQAYTSYLDRLFLFFIDHSMVDSVNTHFDKLTLLRPDPDAANDRIRLKQISAYLRQNRIHSATEELAQIESGVPLLYKLRFALGGLYFDQQYFVVAIASVLGAAVILFAISLFLRLKVWVLEAFRSRKPSPTQEVEDEIPPTFVQSGFIRSMSPSMVEYRECLSVFGLVPGVTLKEIKAAYRMAVKEVHPDLQKKLDADASERFINMTKTYERILELHEQVDLPKPVMPTGDD